MKKSEGKQRKKSFKSHQKKIKMHYKIKRCSSSLMLQGVVFFVMILFSACFEEKEVRVIFVKSESEIIENPDSIVISLGSFFEDDEVKVCLDDKVIFNRKVTNISRNITIAKVAKLDGFERLRIKINEDEFQSCQFDKEYNYFFIKQDMEGLNVICFQEKYDSY